MKFEETKLKGAFIVDIEPHEDHRGFFSRAFCAEEFKAHGIDFMPVQANLSGSKKKGTLRGMHYQVAPANEAKFIRAIRGRIYDVVIDMREDSPTYLEHLAVELSADNYRAIFVPPMFAHGHQALQDDVEIFYLVGEYYTPGCERGLRYDDPRIGIEWPVEVSVISDKDLSWDPIHP